MHVHKSNGIRGFIIKIGNCLGDDRRSSHGHGQDFATGQIQGKVVGIAFVHDFHTQIGAVDNVGPGVDDTALRVNDGLVKVETVQVKGHGGHTHGSQPDTNHGPGGQEKVQGTRVVEGSVLEDETTKVSVSGNNVVGFFFLTKLVTVVGGFAFSGFANQGGSDQGTVHGRKKGSAKDTGNTSHVEGVHQNVVFGLEDQHKVKGSGDTKGHTIREGSLSNGVVEEHSSGGGYGGRKGGKDPRTHTQTVGQFPFTAHVGGHTSQKVQDNQLVFTTIVQPFIHRSGFPDGVQVHANGVGGGDNGTRNNVVTVQQRSSNGFTDSINIDCGKATMLVHSFLLWYNLFNQGAHVPGGAAMKAVIKQVVAARRVGNMRVPNHPM